MNVPQGAEHVLTEERKEERVAELDATIFRCWARRREENIKLGRAFDELKKIIGHGKWKRHFKEKFKPQGIHLRTAQRYMRLAKDEDSRSDKLSLFSPATDSEAQQIKSATEEAEAEVDAELRKNSFRKKTHVYRLPLRLTADEERATDELRKSAEWPPAEERIIRLLRRLLVKYEVVGGSKRG